MAEVAAGHAISPVQKRSSYFQMLRVISSYGVPHLCWRRVSNRFIGTKGEQIKGYRGCLAGSCWFGIFARLGLPEG